MRKSVIINKKSIVMCGLALALSAAIYLNWQYQGNGVTQNSGKNDADRVNKSRTRLSDFTFTFRFHALEKEMATHSSVLAWRIPGTAEPGGLSSMGSHRVGHD